MKDHTLAGGQRLESKAVCCNDNHKEKKPAEYKRYEYFTKGSGRR